MNVQYKQGAYGKMRKYDCFVEKPLRQRGFGGKVEERTDEKRETRQAV